MDQLSINDVKIEDVPCNGKYRRGWCEPECFVDAIAKTDKGASQKGIESNITNGKEKKIIPLFFATDDNYLPFLGVTLASIKENSSKNFHYKVYVLHSGVSDNYREKILRFAEKDFDIEFVDVTERIKKISSLICMRDYYTCTTYFRIFIAGMFPQYDKALYLDCDIVVLGDISQLYSYELGDNLIGGAPCEGVNSFDVYKQYVREVDGLDNKSFFNAGVILMNLKKFREEDFYEKFADLLKKYKFVVIQDEDYLNVLSQDNVLVLPRAWNKFPCGKDKLAREDLRIVHYGMTWKPWHYSDIPYQEYFWEYAKQTEFYEDILKIFMEYSEDRVNRDIECEMNLRKLAQSEIDRKDRYFDVYGKCYGKNI